LERNFADLSNRERTVIAWRFPMNGGDMMTLAAVGRTLGLGKERVRQIQNRALEKIRSVLKADLAWIEAAGGRTSTPRSGEGRVREVA
jgi:DNA-directed RNA polymerase sigma subunit (sigma70/sigma32)